MKLIYNISDRPKFGQTLVFAIQQLLAIMAATIVVPVIVNSFGKTNLEMDPAAALLGAGFGTLVYILFTKGRSPVFLGSSFAFLSSMQNATLFGYMGIITGAVFAGLVYVVIAIIIKLVGSKWVSKLMPPVIIGPTVALIGLSLAGNAIGDVQKGNVMLALEDGSSVMACSPLIAIVCALVTFFTVVICTSYGKKMMKLIPFIIGILAGYAVASIFTVIGNAAGIDALKVINFSSISNLFQTINLDSFLHIPKFAFLEAGKEFSTFDWSALGTIALLYVPVAFVVFAEHIADHKNLSTIIEKDLLEDPGLDKTLLGDGVGSMAGAFFGSCPNTTYGESIGCVAITRNASVVSILTAAVLAILFAFFSPFVAFINTIPSCVMGGVCVALYGFIAVSGLKMLRSIDLGLNKNLFVVSSILITGIGGLALNFGPITITPIATALIIGIITNIVVKNSKED